MGRRGRPWYNASKKGFFVTLGGKQVALVTSCENTKENESLAVRAYAVRLDEASKRPEAVLTVALLGDLFMDHVERERSPRTAEWYARHLKSFASQVGKETAAMAVKPLHVTEWLNAHKWNATTRHGAITAVKRLYRWAKRQGHIDGNPIESMEKPTPLSRQKILTHEQVNAILRVTPDEEFRDLIVALRDTGARPNELMTLTADRVDLDNGTWTVTNKTRYATGEQTRKIYLCDSMIELSRKLLARRPAGHLFVNTEGRPWKRAAMGNRYDHWKKKLRREGIELGSEGVAYSLRHLYITDALEKGIPPVTVAELVGHKSLNMIMRIYNKLKHRTEHLREAARNAVNPT